MKMLKFNIIPKEEELPNLENLSISNEEKILDYLRINHGISAKVISTDLKLNKTEINKILYQLKSDKKTSFILSGVTPLWFLYENIPPPKAEMKLSPDENKIINFLSEDEFIFTKDIVKNFKDMKKSDINKILYSLERNGLIIKESENNGTKPRWKLNP
jgi:transcription initiation factor IIE alpha subunit